MKNVIDKCLFISLLLCSVQIVQPEQTPETNNAGRLVTTFLRQVVGNAIIAATHKHNPPAAAQSIKNMFMGFADVVEIAMEDETTRMLDLPVAEFEKVLFFINKTLLNYLNTQEGQKTFDLFLEELKTEEYQGK